MSERLNELEKLRDQSAAKARYTMLLSQHTDHNGNTDLTQPEIDELKIQAGLIERPAESSPAEVDPAKLMKRLSAVADENGQVPVKAALGVLLAPDTPAEEPEKPSYGSGGGGVRDEGPALDPLRQEIQRAEQAGDWDRAGALKAQMIRRA